MVKVDRDNIDAKKPDESDCELFITVFADASHCPNTNAWGIGVWVRDGQNPIHTFGKGGKGLKNSTEAELKGLDEALLYIIENCIIGNRVIVIQCDNTGALNKLDDTPLYDLCARFVKLKHVKGHSGKRTRRSKVNNIVDRIARKYMEANRQPI